MKTRLSVLLSIIIILVGCGIKGKPVPPKPSIEISAVSLKIVSSTVTTTQESSIVSGAKTINTKAKSDQRK